MLIPWICCSLLAIASQPWSASALPKPDGTTDDIVDIIHAVGIPANNADAKLVLYDIEVTVPVKVAAEQTPVSSSTAALEASKKTRTRTRTKTGTKKHSSLADVSSTIETTVETSSHKTRTKSKKHSSTTVSTVVEATATETPAPESSATESTAHETRTKSKKDSSTVVSTTAETTASESTAAESTTHKTRTKSKESLSSSSTVAIVTSIPIYSNTSSTTDQPASTPPRVEDQLTTSHKHKKKKSSSTTTTTTTTPPAVVTSAVIDENGSTSKKHTRTRTKTKTKTSVSLAVIESPTLSVPSIESTEIIESTIPALSTSPALAKAATSTTSASHSVTTTLSSSSSTESTALAPLPSLSIFKTAATSSESPAPPTTSKSSASTASASSSASKSSLATSASKSFTSSVSSTLEISSSSASSPKSSSASATTPQTFASSSTPTSASIASSSSPSSSASPSPQSSSTTPSTPSLTTTQTSATAASTGYNTYGKRGLSYNDIAYTEFFGTAAGSQVSWMYNWYSAPCSTGESSYSCGTSPELQFIPMLWSNAADLTSVWAANVAAAAAAGVQYLFSFNEPDLCVAGAGSSCMTPAEAAAAYKTYMDPYAGRFQLGAPAVTNGGAPNGVTWLGEFLGNCTGCTIDFVNAHWYSNVYAGSAYFIEYMESFREATGGQYPVWVTEFALNDDDTFTAAQNQAFLEECMAWMDETDWIVGYAYFMDSEGLLVNSAGTAESALGQIYDTYSGGSTVGGLLT